MNSYERILWLSLPPQLPPTCCWGWPTLYILLTMETHTPTIHTNFCNNGMTFIKCLSASAATFLPQTKYLSITFQWQSMPPIMPMIPMMPMMPINPCAVSSHCYKWCQFTHLTPLYLPLFTQKGWLLRLLKPNGWHNCHIPDNAIQHSVPCMTWMTMTKTLSETHNTTISNDFLCHNGMTFTKHLLNHPATFLPTKHTIVQCWRYQLPYLPGANIVKNGDHSPIQPPYIPFCWLNQDG